MSAPITFTMTINEFGLYVFTANNGAIPIPGFLRPPVEETHGGLARQTSVGNYHGAFIEIHEGVERLVVDQKRFKKVVWEISNRWHNVVMRARTRAS